MKKFIVTADDFGVYQSINQGIRSAIRAGKVNSVAAFSNFESSVDFATDLLAEFGDAFDLGCHLTITSGKPVTGSQAARTMCDGEYFNGYDEFKRGIETVALENELHAQIEVFTGNNIPVKHLSCHHNVLTLFPEIFDMYMKVARDLNIPMRSVCLEPEIKQNLYVVALHLMLLDDLTLRDLGDMRRFNRSIVDYFEKNGQGIKTPDVVNTKHYGPVPFINVPDHKVSKKALKKQKQLRRQLKKFIKSNHETLEVMVHLIEGNVDEQVDYPGINKKYFDSRAVEFASLMGFNFSNIEGIEIGRWKDL